MNPKSLSQVPRNRFAVVLGIGTLGALCAAPALGCSFNYPLTAPSGLDKAMQNVAATSSTNANLMSRGEFPEAASHSIVGTWRVSFVSDGSAHPGPIPAGAIVDFGTVQWHDDGTE